MHHYPFHPGDYMLDTAHLEPLHDLCYRRALDLYYTSEGPLADDKRTLSKRLRVAEQTLSEVLAEFFVLTENGWKHPRCDEEIRRYHAKSEAAKKAGSLGGKAKKALSLANAKHPLSERLANQEPRTKNQNQEPKEEKALPLPFDSAEFSEAWSKWTQHRKEIRKPLKPTMIQEQLRDLQTMGERRAIAAIRYTISKGWQGLREPEQQQDYRRTPKNAAYNAQTHTAGMSGDDIGLFTPDQR